MQVLLIIRERLPGCKSADVQQLPHLGLQLCCFTKDTLPAVVHCSCIVAPVAGGNAEPSEKAAAMLAVCWHRDSLTAAT